MYNIHMTNYFAYFRIMDTLKYFAIICCELKKVYTQDEKLIILNSVFNAGFDGIPFTGKFTNKIFFEFIN